MLKTRVIPCLLLKNQGLVKTIKFDKLAYIGDPINTVRIYNEKEVDELIFLDITATSKHQKPDLRIISEIASECFMPFTYGGGVHCSEDVQKIFSLGVEKIAINSCAVKNPSFIKEISERFGSQSIVVSIDVKRSFWGRYRVWSHSERTSSNLDPVQFAVLMERMGAGELLLTSVDRDGTMEGYDIDLIKQVTGAVNIPVIVCGGAGNMDHFAKAVSEGGAAAVAAGSMVVYQGKNRSVLINFPSKSDIRGVFN